MPLWAFWKTNGSYTTDMFLATPPQAPQTAPKDITNETEVTAQSPDATSLESVLGKRQRTSGDREAEIPPPQRPCPRNSDSANHSSRSNGQEPQEDPRGATPANAQGFDSLYDLTPGYEPRPQTKASIKGEHVVQIWAY
jgi:hypothetical protein